MAAYGNDRCPECGDCDRRMTETFRYVRGNEVFTEWACECGAMKTAIENKPAPDNAALRNDLKLILFDHDFPKWNVCGQHGPAPMPDQAHEDCPECLLDALVKLFREWREGR